jgi:uncharacterized protein
MSKSFVKDPRAVVKSGDVVKVKVLEVDVARKRIALTLRLDDELGAKSERAAQDFPRDKARSMTSTLSKPHQQSGGGALAEALRRANEKNERGKSKA